MTDKPVSYEASNGVARIILKRGPVNALNFEMIRDVVAAFEAARKDERIRAVVLTSALSKAFSAGLDLNLLVGTSEKKIRTLLQELYVGLHDAQYNLGKPSIAAVGGAARGGGMTWAISCDVILAGQSATFGYPEIDVGVVPARMTSHEMANVIPPPRAAPPTAAMVESLARLVRPGHPNAPAVNAAAPR